MKLGKFFLLNLNDFLVVTLFAGVDNCGRTVMAVVGRNIPVTLIDMEKVRF